jgi:CubicO group peptidase (beta-lactamase class C family)
MIPLRSVALLSLVAAGAAFARADTAALKLPRSTPEEQGVSSSAILDFVNAAEQKVDALHSVMIVRHGHVVAEGWWTPYAAEEPHSMFSLSKSFTSTAFGLAIADGKLSLDDPVLKFFPDEAPAVPSKNLASMRVRDLLRMSSGQRADDLKDFPYLEKQDLVRVFLELPVPDIPGTHFVYNTPATYMLSAIVQKATGQSVLAFLGPRLFEPLGIAGATWEASTQGVSLGGFGLSIRTEDIAHFGQLYLQRGQWQGRQVVPAEWVDAATSVQTANGSDPTSDWNQGYGYQFWRCRHGFFRGDGAYGQFCIVMPQWDAVVAITSGTGDMQMVMNLVWDKILPAFNASSLPLNPESDRRLSEKLAGLSLRTQAGQATSPMAPKVFGKRYSFPDNAQHIEALTLESPAGGAGTRLILRTAGVDQSCVCGYGSWSKDSSTGAPGKAVPIAASGAWSSDDTYSATLVRYQTPISTEYDLRFSDGGVILEALDNVGNSPPTRIRVIGTAEP